jgi:hypothetical protein
MSLRRPLAALALVAPLALSSAARPVDLHGAVLAPLIPGFVGGVVQSGEGSCADRPPVPALDAPIAEPTTDGGRDAWRWPFASTSPWNTPIGSGARFEDRHAKRTAQLTDPGPDAWVNAGQYSIPIYRARAGDPLAIVRDECRTLLLRVPEDARPAEGTDAALFVVDPTGRWVDETWQMSGGPVSWSAAYHVRNDLYGDGVGDGGVRAAAGSGVGGVIRQWEVDAGEIRHALALVLTNEQLARGPVWPAVSEDGDAARTYRGSIPIGTLVAIPPDVDVARLGLTPAGEVVSRALQDYGAYVVDRASAVVLYAEPSLEGTNELEAMREDMPSIRRQLRVVANSGPQSVGGGGTPRRPPAPPLRPPS